MDEMVIKIGFIWHDLHDRLEIDHVNDIMAQINEPVTITELRTFSDEYGYAVHNSCYDLSTIFTEEVLDNMWFALTDFRYGDYEEDYTLTPYIQDDILVIPIKTLQDYIENN